MHGQRGDKLREGRFRPDIRKEFCEGGETLEPVAQRCCEGSNPGSVRGQIGWGPKQHGLVKGIPVHICGGGTR